MNYFLNFIATGIQISKSDIIWLKKKRYNSVMCRRTGISRNEPSAEGFFYLTVPINFLGKLAGERRKDYLVCSGPQVNHYRFWDMGLGFGILRNSLSNFSSLRDSLCCSRIYGRNNGTCIYQEAQKPQGIFACFGIHLFW